MVRSVVKAECEWMSGETANDVKSIAQQDGPAYAKKRPNPRTDGACYIVLFDIYGK